MLRFLQRDYGGARTALEDVLKRGGMDLGASELLMQTYAAQGDPSKGLKRLEEIAGRTPTSAPLQNLLGQWYLRTGNLPGARQAFARAAAADPHLTAANVTLAELDLREGHADSARQKLAGIVAAGSKNISALLALAHVENDLGDRASAMQAYREILAVNPSNLIALNNLAYILAADSPDEALNFAQKAVEMAPDEAGIQDTLGWIYYRKGLYSMAVPYLKKAVQTGSTPRRQFHLGMSYLKSGDQITGRKLIAEALRSDATLAKTEQGW
jgi:Tfp pilus assembly protein PilF